MSRIFRLLIIVGIIPSYIDSFLRIYYTNRNPAIGKYDCLSTTQNGDGYFESEFCRRPIDVWQFVSNIDGKEKCKGDIKTFEEMRLNRVTGEGLLLDFASIDIIDQYEIYLENWNSTYVNNSEDYFCNCTIRELQAFGRNCEYTLDIKLEDEELKSYSRTHQRTNHIFIKYGQSLYTTKKENYQNTKEICYIDLPECRTLSGMCLQLNEICDGKSSIFSYFHPVEFCRSN